MTSYILVSKPNTDLLCPLTKLLCEEELFASLNDAFMIDAQSVYPDIVPLDEFTETVKR